MRQKKIQEKIKKETKQKQDTEQQDQKKSVITAFWQLWLSPIQ
jgi:hypothetical protein